jgi:hypothetical protein
LSGWSGVGSTLSKPGKKNDAGETLWLALMPLQPASNNPNKGVATSHKYLCFQFNFTTA